jgi:two-component system, OmpR family, phosphate regulon sensor histidine kinase PhoR
VIKRNADRLGAIIEDLLALSRIEQTPFAGDLARQTMPVRPVIEAAIAHHEQASRAKQIAINLQADARLEAPIDAQLLEQALSNLLSNAIKYSPTASSITVTCDQLNQELIAIAVADQGPGISAEHLPRLFERFYRVDRARSREMGGTGLGLAIVKHIAQAHGGRAEVSSSLRRGSTFRIILPLR